MRRGFRRTLPVFAGFLLTACASHPPVAPIVAPAPQRLAPDLCTQPNPSPAAVNYLEARRIINGMDRADDIAGYARQFETALVNGGWTP